MRLDNPAPDESVNYTIEHPLKEFAWLIGGVFAVVVAVTTLVSWFAGDVAALLPYRHEKQFADRIAAHMVAPVQSDSTRMAARDINTLAAKLAQVMELPDELRVTVHLNEGLMVNAYATLGANIVLYHGLLEKMPDENALAMVLAHEIAHTKLRHPVKSLGRGVAVGVILGMVSAAIGHSAAGNVTTTSGGLTLLKYSRDQERDADALALHALARHYGHIGGAHDVFRVLETANNLPERGQIEMFGTHPLSAARIEHITRLATARGWPADGVRTPMPVAIAALRGVHDAARR